ncbi:MAG: TIGR02117 family protein [Albidovulum sp.]
MRRLFLLAGFLLGLPVVYLIASLIGAVIASGQDWPEGGVRVGLLRGPIHYDFLLPLNSETRREFAFAESGLGVSLSAPGARWLVAGWGSQAFYTTAGSYADVQMSAVLRAATGDKAVMRLDVFGALPETDQPGLHWISLTSDQFSELRRGILASLDRDAAGAPILADVAGIAKTDGFWLALGRFDLIRTCNVWVGDQLRAAGLRFGVWTPTPQSIDLSLRLFAR